MDFDFTGELIEWRGPAPYFFVRLDVDLSADIKLAAKGLEYWGQVPVTVWIGETEFFTGLFPKDGGYLVPVRLDVRRAEDLHEGMIIAGELTVGRRADLVT